MLERKSLLDQPKIDASTFKDPGFKNVKVRCFNWIFAAEYNYQWHLHKSMKTLLLPVCCYCVMYAFQSESALCSCLNVKELLAQKRYDIWSLSDSNRIWTHNHLVLKWTLNHLAKWLSVRLWTKWLWVRIPLLSLIFFVIATKEI